MGSESPTQLSSWTTTIFHNLLMWVQFAQACLTLCDPKDYSPPNSSVHEILQAGIVEWVAIPFSRGSSQCKGQTHVSLIAGGFFTIWATGKSKNTGVGSLSFAMGSSQPRNRTGVSCIASRFFTAETPRKPDVLLMYLPLKAIQLLPGFCCDQRKCCSVFGWQSLLWVSP